MGLFGSTAASAAATSVEAHIALLRARIEQKNHQAKSAAAAAPTKLGPEVHQLFTALAKHHAMFGSPDQGLELAMHGNERIEVGATRFQVRAKDGMTTRPATTDDLAAVGLWPVAATRTGLANKLKRVLGMPESTELDDQALIAAVAPAIENGKAQVKALSKHPDALRLLAQRRGLAGKSAGSVGPIDLLGPNNDAALTLDHKGKLEFRFGKIKRTPTVGDLHFVGFADEQRVAEHLGQRLVEGSQKPERSAEQVRAEIDDMLAAQQREAADKAATEARIAKAQADYERFLKTPTTNSKFKFLAELRSQMKRPEIIIATATDSAQTEWQLVVTKAGHPSPKHVGLFLTRRGSPGGLWIATTASLRDRFGINSVAELEQAIEKAILAISPKDL